MLANSNFITAGPYGIYTQFATNKAHPDYSAAEHWTLWSTSGGMIETELVSGCGPSGPTSLIRVMVTGKDGGGLVQTFGNNDTGPARVHGSAWIYVVRGKVGLGIGNGGNTSITTLSTTTGIWEELKTENGVAPANELIIYAQEMNPGLSTIFYVDRIMVEELPARV